MLNYTMDVEEQSRWLRCTPGPLHFAQGFHCSEVGEFYAHERFMTERDAKESYLVFYTVSGAGEVMQGSSIVKLGRGDALLMDCRTPQRYRTHPDAGRWHHLWAHVDGVGLHAMADAMGLPSLMPVHLQESSARNAFDYLTANVEQEDAASIVRTGLAAHELVALVAAALATPTSANEEASREVVHIVEDYIGEHYREPITVDDLAAAATVSKTYLIRLFKRHLATTPYNYLLRSRITHAKELLAETTMPVSRIAGEVGFSSESNFSYRFSQVVGESPSSYRSGTPGLSE